MTKTALTPKQASGIMVFLLEEMGDARLRCAQLKKYVKEATDLIEKSEHRDHFFEIAGHLIHGIPDALMRLDHALDASAMAASRLDYDEIKNGLRPEKAEELENVLQDVRLRYLNRRSNEGAMEFKFRAHTGPTQVEEVTKRLEAAGIDAHAGTEHVYGVVEGASIDEAAHKINEAAKFKLVKPYELHKTASDASPITHQLVGAFLAGAKDVTTHMDVTATMEDVKTAGQQLARVVEEVTAHAFQANFMAKAPIGSFTKLADRIYDLAWYMGATSIPGTAKTSHTATRSPNMNAKTAAYFLSKIADITEKGGRVPTAALMTLIAQLEGQDKTATSLAPKAASAFRGIANELTSQKNPSRVKLAGVLRRILADTMDLGFGPQDQQPQHQQQQQQGAYQQQAGAGEEFQKANPKITDEEAKVIDEMHAKHENVVKDKHEA
jgi:hypothetical protein